MKKILLLCFVSLTMMATWYGCSKDEEESEKLGSILGSIYGIVTVTGEPLKGVGVSLYTSGGSLLLKTVTYDDGHYEFTDLTPGEYEIVVEGDAYEEFSVWVTVEAGRQARADMQLTLADTGLTVVTCDAEVLGRSAILKGQYTYAYRTTPTEWGFYYSTSKPVSAGTKVVSSGKTETNTSYTYTFDASISNLSPGKYYVQAYAKNAYGLTYGDIKTFSTSNDPAVKTLAVTNVTESTATLNGEVVYAGNPEFIERGFVYSSSFANPTVEDPSSSTKRKVVSGKSTSFSANIDNLTKGTTYHVRAYVTNANGTFYGESVDFVPLDPNVIRISSLGLMIQKYDLSSGADWNTAKTLCENSTVGGYTDWRLPTIGELASIYKYGVSVNWAENSVGKFFKDWYWSSSPKDNIYYYVLSMSNGGSDYWGEACQSCTYRVRAVRIL
ncbi:MAG: DUF1566 domain-containing protein [Bacteroidales bacterium]|nr:DUF1566 domain-containing protein [Candidatus Colimorpha onthohippi]